jgi:hypothetical protein
VLNRHGSLGPAAGLRSRGELVLEALDHADAVDAAAALSYLDPGSYRSFNLIVADNRDGFWLRHTGKGRIEARPLPDGLSVIAAGDVDELTSPRLAQARPRFRAAPPPDPDRDDWTSWQDLLGDDSAPPDAPPEAAMRFRAPGGFGTVSSALIALPAEPSPERPSMFRYAAWLPDPSPWRNVDVS